MGEERAIAGHGQPVTRGEITAGLRDLGVEPGMVLLVHSSLSSLGWVPGGAHAVVLALVEAVGPQGTLVMPTHSTHLTDPSIWVNPPVPENWWPVIRETSPAFDVNLTPTRQMGAIVECFRHLPGVIRSPHPHHSFAATGPRAQDIIGVHALADSLGEGSPLAQVYDADGAVLLLGVGHGNNTSLHLGEYRSDYPGKRWTKNGARVLVEGEERWVEFDELDVDSGDFEQLGAGFATTGKERIGRVGAAEARLMRQRDLVDYAVGWFASNRRATSTG